MLQHQHLVGRSDGDRAAGAALADDDGDHWRAQSHHFPQVEGDGFRDIPLFRADPGESPRSVNECDDRQAKFLSHAHETKRLAVTLRMGTAKVTQQILLGVTTFLMADDDDFFSTPCGKTCWHGLVITDVAVTVQFGKVFAAMLHVIQHEGAIGMTRDLHALPGIEIGMDFAQEAFCLFLHVRDLTGQLVTGLSRKFLFSLFDLFAEFDDGLFEFQDVFHVKRGD